MLRTGYVHHSWGFWYFVLVHEFSGTDKIPVTLTHKQDLSAEEEAEQNCFFHRAASSSGSVDITSGGLQHLGIYKPFPRNELNIEIIFEKVLGQISK